MNNLEMCKAIAKLEDVSVELPEYSATVLYITGGSEAYNPITDLALNCALRDKYKVEIDYNEMRVSIYTDKAWFTVDYFPKREPNNAVIFCILKANGLYTEGGEDE